MNTSDRSVSVVRGLLHVTLIEVLLPDILVAKHLVVPVLCKPGYLEHSFESDCGLDIILRQLEDFPYVVVGLHLVDPVTTIFSDVPHLGEAFQGTCVVKKVPIEYPLVLE